MLPFIGPSFRKSPWDLLHVGSRAGHRVNEACMVNVQTILLVIALSPRTRMINDMLTVGSEDQSACE